MSVLSNANNFTVRDSSFISQSITNQYGRSGEQLRFGWWNVSQSSTRYRYPLWNFPSRSCIWFSRPLRSPLLLWHSGTIHCWHHKLGHWICQHAFVYVLDEGASWCWKIGHRSDMCRETQRNWTPWCCILLHCEQTHQSLTLIHYYCLSTRHYAPWLSRIYWRADLKGQDTC